MVLSTMFSKGFGLAMRRYRAARENGDQAQQVPMPQKVTITSLESHQALYHFHHEFACTPTPVQRNYSENTFIKRYRSMFIFPFQMSSTFLNVRPRTLLKSSKLYLTPSSSLKVIYIALALRWTIALARYFKGSAKSRSGLLEKASRFWVRTGVALYLELDPVLWLVIHQLNLLVMTRSHCRTHASSKSLLRGTQCARPSHTLLSSIAKLRRLATPTQARQVERQTPAGNVLYP